MSASPETTHDAPSAPCRVCKHRYVFAGLFRRGDEWVCWWCADEEQDPEPAPAVTPPVRAEPPDPPFELEPPPPEKAPFRRRKGVAMPDKALAGLPKNIQAGIMRRRKFVQENRRGG